MSEAEALTKIAYFLEKIFVELAGIDFLLLVMLLFKNMGKKEK